MANMHSKMMWAPHTSAAKHADRMHHTNRSLPPPPPQSAALREPKWSSVLLGDDLNRFALDTEEGVALIEAEPHD